MSKILIITNHSYMLYRFRLELIQELRKTHEVVLSMPFVGHEEDFQALGIRCIETNVDRRGLNPKRDWALFRTYQALLKAAAAGRPVITSDIPGCREAVDDGKTGLLCKARDPDSLYQQMRKMADLPPAERQSMGKAAHEKMAREFDKHRVVAATIHALFEKTAQARP